MSLVRTSAGAYLNEDAARSYEALNADFARTFGKRLDINSGARTYAQQAEIFRDSYNPFYTVAELGRVEIRWWNGQRWYRKPWRATVAAPGTSNHEYPPGRAADFSSGVQNMTTAEHAWMRRWAGGYGWVWTGEHFPTVEPWHWEKIGNPDWAGGGGTPLPTPTPKPEPEPIFDQEDNMARINFPTSQGKAFYLTATRSARKTTEEEMRIQNKIADDGKKSVSISNKEAQVVLEPIRQAMAADRRDIAAAVDKSLRDDFAELEATLALIQTDPLLQPDNTVEIEQA